MSRSRYTGPSLPKTLLDQVQNTNDSRFQQNGASRKFKRKAERQQKKAIRAQPQARRPHVNKSQHVESDGDSSDEEEDEVIAPPKPAPKGVDSAAKPPRSILKKSQPAPPTESEESDEEQLDEEDADWDSKSDGSLNISSRAAKAGLADEDAAIAALEKRLGVKGKKSAATRDDDLDWLVGGSASEGEDERANLKRKRPEDAKWLRDKRLKAAGGGDAVDAVDDDDSDDQMSDLGAGSEEDVIENPFSDDELDSDDFDGFEEGEDERPAKPIKRQRENPYVAPITADAASTAKYIPPSMRKAAFSDEDLLKQLQRQIKGLLNRLSVANMLSILQSLEDIYNRNARQHVTSTLVDLLVGLTSDPSVLNDTFLILQAGFAAAVYKVIGTDFGAQLLEKVVESIDQSRAREAYSGKQVLNLLAFVSNLYNFQLVGSTMLYDYIRMLLTDLSENNTELLLRILRTSGQQLRQDDPTALKDIVLLLQRSVTSTGEANLSIRTKFMIETIHNLKNNRLKTGAAVSALATEHTTHMKKTLSSLQQTRPIKATEPLRVSLADLHDSEKKGKWWLIGASYHDPAKLATTPSTSSRQATLDAGYDSETPGSTNLHRLARAQGMNTDVRRALFIATLSSTDCKEAHERIIRLHLRHKQMLELPRVLVHCAGAEASYNPFYALVARGFCGEQKLRKAFEFTLWDVLKRVENADDVESEEEGETKPIGMRELVNVAKFYGFLIAEGVLGLGVLKKLDPGFAFTAAESKTVEFVEVLLTAVLLGVSKRGGEEVLKGVFGTAKGLGGVLPGLKVVLEKRVGRADLVGKKKERKVVARGVEVAEEVLEELVRGGGVIDEDEESE